LLDNRYKQAHNIFRVFKRNSVLVFIATHKDAHLVLIIVRGLQSRELITIDPKRINLPKISVDRVFVRNIMTLKNNNII